MVRHDVHGGPLVYRAPQRRTAYAESVLHATVADGMLVALSETVTGDRAVKPAEFRPKTRPETFKPVEIGATWKLIPDTMDPAVTLTIVASARSRTPG